MGAETPTLEEAKASAKEWMAKYQAAAQELLTYKYQAEDTNMRANLLAAEVAKKDRLIADLVRAIAALAGGNRYE